MNAPPTAPSIRVAHTPPPTLDAVWTEPEHLTAFDRFFLARIRDRRDLVQVRTAAKIFLAIFPLAVALFLLPTWLTALAGAPYLAWVYAGWCAPYVLTLHTVAHRPLFKKEYDRWNDVIPWLLGPLFGMTPTSYAVHHIGMHHVENNLEADLSGTIGYERDNYWHFLHYWARFTFFSYRHLPRYLSSRRRTKLLRRFFVGEFAWLATAVFLFWLNPVATAFVLLLPLFLIRYLMMCGNWAQHAFVDVDDAGNNFKNSVCLTNARYNLRCYNDGYHIVHHEKPTLHWSEMPGWYRDNWARFVEHDAIIFDGIANNQVVFNRLMAHDYDFLAQHMLVLPGRERTHDEKVELLKSRVRRTAHARKGMWELRESPAATTP